MCLQIKEVHVCLYFEITWDPKDLFCMCLMQSGKKKNQCIFLLLFDFVGSVSMTLGRLPNLFLLFLHLYPGDNLVYPAGLL